MARDRRIATSGGRLSLLLALAACSDSADEDPTETFARSAEVPGGREVALVSSVGTEQSGRVTFAAEGDSLLVSVELAGVGAGAHRGFIRHGESCDAPGAAIAELPTVNGADGDTASASHRIGLPELSEPRAVVAYHEPNQTPGHVILCGMIAPDALP